MNQFNLVPQASQSTWCSATDKAPAANGRVPNSFEVAYQPTSQPVVHIIPCITKYEGEAKVDAFFIPTITEQGEYLKNHMLGRKFLSKKEGFQQKEFQVYRAIEEKDHEDLVFVKVDRVQEWSKDIPAKKSRLNRAREWAIAQHLLHDQ